MVGLCEYDNATYDECVDDFNEIMDYLDTYLINQFDYDVLEKKGIRIQEIAKRLKELRGAK